MYWPLEGALGSYFKLASHFFFLLIYNANMDFFS